MNQVTMSFLYAFLGVLVAGCAGSAPSAKIANYKKSESSRDSTIDSIESFDSDPDSAAEPPASTQSPILATRKIIYVCQIGLVVENYGRFEAQLPQLVANYGGFIASNDTNRRYQDNQSGNWVIRIPVEQYSAFLSGVDSFGFAESRTENAQDVTEEYVDVEARIKTKRQLETRILKMLEERPGKLTDVLQIERELSRVREEVERMEGRIRYLKDRTNLATITINCREEQEYMPAAAPTLASRISQSWSNSLASIRQIAETALVSFIAAVPWLIVLSIIALITLVARKRFGHRRQAV